jgi:hypothetical protein
MSAGRVTPLPSDDDRWSGDLRHYRHPDGRPIELFSHLAASPHALGDLRSATTACLTSPLPVRFREVIILRVCGQMSCWSEWDTHIELFAPAANLSESDLRLLKKPSPGDQLEEVDRLPVALVDELLSTGRLADATWIALREVLSEAQALDSVMVAGQYLKVTWLANVVGLNG